MSSGEIIDQVTWSQKHTDFTIVTASGKELKCHKFILAENSPVFDAMLEKDCTETTTDKMDLKHIEEETLIKFVQYLYAQSTDEAATKGHASAGLSEYVYHRRFPKEDLTLDLLSIGHMYDVKDLEMDCASYLKANISDDNVMEIWIEAERCKNAVLCQSAIKHLVDRPKENPLGNVPGFTEAFKSNEKPIVNLLSAMSEKIIELHQKEDEIEKLKSELDRKSQSKQLKGRCKSCKRENGSCHSPTCYTHHPLTIVNIPTIPSWVEFV